MGNRPWAVIALIITIVYGVGFAFFDEPSRAYVVGGALVVCLAWVLTGTLGRSRD